MNHTKGNCYNCGADEGLHQYETMKCPRNGIEARVGAKQEWIDTVFEDAQQRKLQDAAPDLLEVIKNMHDTFESITNRGERPSDINWNFLKIKAEEEIKKQLNDLYT